MFNNGIKNGVKYEFGYSKKILGFTYYRDGFEVGGHGSGVDGALTDSVLLWTSAQVKRCQVANDKQTNMVTRHKSTKESGNCCGLPVAYIINMVNF